MKEYSEYNHWKRETSFVQKTIRLLTAYVIYYYIADNPKLSGCFAADNSIYLATNCSDPLPCATLQSNWISHVLLIRQVYMCVCVSHFFRFCFFSACRKGLKHTHTGTRKHAHTLTGWHMSSSRMWGCEPGDVCACKLRIKAYVENIYCPLRIRQNENENFISWLLAHTHTHSYTHTWVRVDFLTWFLVLLVLS